MSEAFLGSGTQQRAFLFIQVWMWCVEHWYLSFGYARPLSGNRCMICSPVGTRPMSCFGVLRGCIAGASHVAAQEIIQSVSGL
jgi:hypothetical protein